MTSELSKFAARIRGIILSSSVGDDVRSLTLHSPCAAEVSGNFDSLARELFQLQFATNVPYRTLCEARNISPDSIKFWEEIPAVPTSAFKEFEISCLPPKSRTDVFHSSGTTAQKPSRHFHNAESLAVYEASLLAWFRLRVQPTGNLVILTPPSSSSPNSSLVHMFETIRRDFAAAKQSFLGTLDDNGSWTLNFAAATERLDCACRSGERIVMLGTAFSFVHLLDHLAEKGIRFKLPPGSQIMETGGYKNKSRVLPKVELHALLARHLGVSSSDILCEYGMSELSSQAYDGVTSGEWRVTGKGNKRHFCFPPWARSQVISPETGREVAEGETGLLRIFDLANVFSVLAVQTEDLAVRRGDGFELLGRAELAEARGCSLMTA